MKLADVLTPAISYAQNGHPLVERANATIRTVEKLFRDHWPTSAAIYLKDGKPAETGKLFTNPTMAATYTRVLKEAESAGGDRVAQIEKARKVWSQGFVAEAIDKFCRTQAVMDTSGTPHKGVLTGQDMAKWQARPRSAADLRLRPLHRLQAAVEPGPGDIAAARAAQGLQPRRPRRGRAGLHPSGGGVLEARLRRPREILRRSGFRRGAVPDAALGRLQRRAAQARHRQGVAGVAAGLGRGLRLDRQAEARRQARRRHGRGRADRRPHGRSGRRHRAFRHRRPGRQHGDGDAVRRLAAILAGHPRARLLPRHPRPDVLAGGRPSGLARARQAAAHDAVADLGAARRRRLSRLGLARRRPAGPVDHAVLPAPRPRRDESAGGDRRAGLALRAFPDLVLAAHLAARRAADREARAEGNPRRTDPARPHHRGRAGMVGRPPHRGVEGRQAPPRRRQSARHARLCGGALCKQFRTRHISKSTEKSPRKIR